MMSLGLYSNVWLGLIFIGTQVVEGLTCKFGVESLALTETCPDTNFHDYWHYSLRVFKKKKNMDKMGKTFLGIIFTFGALLLSFLVIQFSFHILSAIKLLKVKMT